MTRTNQILLAVVAAGVAICAFYFLALAPKRDEVAKLDADIAAKEAELQASQATLATYEAARGTYKENYATLARLGKAVPEDDDMRSLLVQLEATAEGTDVDFQTIELSGGSSAPTDGTATAATGDLAAAPGLTPISGGALSALPFRLTFNGEFFDLSTFLARLERFVSVENDNLDATGRLLRLESIQIQPASAGFPQMQAQIGAASYVVPPVQPVSAAPAATATPATAAPADSSTPPTTTATATGGAQ
jgi:Tfp pilus assembly protein PilO